MELPKVNERVAVGKSWKHHADAIGTDVVTGVNSLIQPAVVLRHGTQEQKRTLLGGLIDDFDIRTVPSAETAQQFDEFGDPGRRRSNAGVLVK